ncbi:hypothetical protein LTS15_000078 [Exophiala xenobiotica]|nr:hypothetical protein LTS15_000078 [Exophiala xenobiotica]
MVHLVRLYLPGRSSCHLGDPIQGDDNFELIQESTFYTSYVDGSSRTGALLNTSQQIAGITVPEQTIGLVKSVSLTGDGIMSSLLGLAYPGLTTATEDSTPIAYSLIINTIFTEDLASPIFALAISRDASNSGFGGYLTIGGIPDSADALVNASSTYASAEMQVNPLFQGPRELKDYPINVDAVSWSNSILVHRGLRHHFDPCCRLGCCGNERTVPASATYTQGYWQDPCTALAPDVSFTIGGVV